MERISTKKKTKKKEFQERHIRNHGSNINIITRDKSGLSIFIFIRLIHFNEYRDFPRIELTKVQENQ